VKIDEQAWTKLREAAEAASRNAYCPYSSFPVGAAVLSPTGEIFAGCNVENASFGLTICAERSAIFNAIANGAREIQAVVVFTNTGKPSLPCGACRQVIYEFGTKIELRCYCRGEGTEKTTIEYLLPKGFGLKEKSSGD
jgi:cytidine deaminase